MEKKSVKRVPIVITVTRRAMPCYAPPCAPIIHQPPHQSYGQYGMVKLYATINHHLRRINSAMTFL